MSRKGGVQGITFDCVSQADALLRNPTALWLAIGCLPGDCILQSWPGTDSHNRPVTAESEHPTSGLNTVPCPGALSPLGAYVGRPRFQRVIVRIRMQWLHAGDDSELSEAGN